MTKKEIDEIRPECRKLVIKSQIIDLTHQLYSVYLFHPFA